MPSYSFKNRQFASPFSYFALLKLNFYGTIFEKYSSSTRLNVNEGQSSKIRLELLLNIFTLTARAGFLEDFARVQFRRECGERMRGCFELVKICLWWVNAWVKTSRTFYNKQ